MEGSPSAQLVLVLEEMGRVLLCAPYFSTVVLAASALSRSGDEAACEELLPTIAAGDCIATLAFEDDGGAVETAALADGAGWRLSGTKSYVLDGHIADVVLVAARSPEGPGLFRCSGDAEGLQRDLLPTLDLTRKQARLTFDGTPAVAVGRPGDGEAVLSSCAATGGRGAGRRAGGRHPVLPGHGGRLRQGADAVRAPHRQLPDASSIVAPTCCWTPRRRARPPTTPGWCAASGDDDLPVAAAMAKAHCSDAYFRAAAENIQIHGGIGFTWEHPAHLYFKRAKSSQLMFGDPAHHRERLGRPRGALRTAGAGGRGRSVPRVPR